MRSRPLAVDLTRAFRLVLWTLLIVLVIALARFGATAWVDQRLDGLIAAEQARAAAHDAMLDRQAALHAYLLTGDDAPLDSYREAAQEVREEDPVVMRSVAGDAEVADLLLATWDRRGEWINDWAEVAIAADDPGELSDDRLFNERGNEAFDGYRAAEATLAAALAERIEATRAVDRLVFLVGTGLIVLAVLVGLVATWRQSVKIRRDVELPLREMLTVIHRVREGDLSAVAQVSGPAELQEIADELGGATRSLAEERTRADRRELELSRLAELAGGVLDFAQDFSSSLELERVVTAIGRGALPLAGMDEARVWLVEHGEEEVVLAHAARQDGGYPSVGSERRRLGETLPGRAAQLGRSLYQHGEELSARAPAKVDGAALPMVAGGLTIGVLELRADTSRPLDATTHELLEKVSTQAGMAMEAARMHGHTQELVSRDPLTSLLNRRQLDADLAAELARYRRYATPCTFVLIDLDHFKEVNDSLGHQAGDEFLSGFSHVLDDTVRATDTAYRYGGEEFALILRQSHAEDGERLLERLRLRSAELMGIGGKRGTITFSAGICEAADVYDEAEFVLRAADRALYEAKRTGRDRWVIAGDSVVALGADTEEGDELHDTPTPA